ncbi:MAG TPA: hypothetical protein VFY14_11215 [Streptomyces sp.]|nr:hypothetical protein [Streptomyces sp.]
MTAFLRAFLYCDGCDEMLDASTVPSARTITEARKEAKRCNRSRIAEAGEQQ